MDGIKYAVFTDKSIRLLGKNQYTSNSSTSGKSRRMGPIMGHTMHYRRMIITLQPGYSIPPLRKKRT
ncbi:hypothetical protein H5410_011734 [Solanum commersonii]|uniref:Ribosomal protein L23 n=1 Tax=Solanum commersonii TaxID=4109 RepID=A0A9J6AQ85_SOLCO|nr:hypothetical protein H5410_011734 [Solanum commersonii]